MEESYNKGFPVSWDQMHRDSKALAWRLAENGPWSRIISITRGGMVPACIVARELDLRMVDTICIKTYDHQDRAEPEILKGVSEDGEDVLIIDDLVDT
ncbi:MAG: xanthine phosphoribosyltransferase, partial [Alphaproteobacteria bacterium]